MSADLSWVAALPFFEVVTVQDTAADGVTAKARVKIRCTLTGHECPPDEAAVKAYAAGKAYARASRHEQQRVAWEKAIADDPDRYGPHIVESIKDKGRKVYCQLTKQLMDRDPAVVEKHMASRRFKRLAKEAEAKAQRRAARAKRREEREKRRAERRAAGQEDAEDSESDSSDDSESGESDSGSDGGDGGAAARRRRRGPDEEVMAWNEEALKTMEEDAVGAVGAAQGPGAAGGAAGKRGGKRGKARGGAGGAQPSADSRKASAKKRSRSGKKGGAAAQRRRTGD